MVAGAGADERIWKNSGRLADGREIVYFDEAPGLGRALVPDGRDLEIGSGGERSRLRFDPLAREWIAYAEHRLDRTFLPIAEKCPFCPSRPASATEIPADSYDVVVLENRFPVFGGAGPQAGRCEVVCFTPEHDSSFADLGRRRAATVIAAWADRTAVLGALPGIEHVLCFENRGEEVGATLHHPHGQIYGLPFVPPRTRRLLASALAYRESHGANLLDDMVAAELADGRRLVQRNDHWTAFVPEAARFPFEVLLFPAARVPDLAALSPAARTALSEVLSAVLRRFDRLFGTPMPYLAVWQQAPVLDAVARAELGLYLQVMGMRRAPGKLKYMASTESGAGVWSNDVLPETAARMLRKAG